MSRPLKIARLPGVLGKSAKHTRSSHALDLQPIYDQAKCGAHENACTIRHKICKFATAIDERLYELDAGAKE